MNDNFSQQSEYYAKFRPRYPKEMYDFIFSNIKNKNAAWDCATGSGQVASYLADNFNEVYANDISANQLSFAPKKKNIKYFNVPSENAGFPSGYFDLITVAQAIHWFDFEKYYAEVRRTAKPGGLIAVIGYGITKIGPDIDGLIHDFDEFTFGKHFTVNRNYVTSSYQTIPFPFKEIKSPEFSHKVKWDLKDVEGFFNSWSAVQRIKNEEGYNPVDDLMKNVKKFWKEDEVKNVEFPIFMRLGKVD